MGKAKLQIKIQFKLRSTQYRIIYLSRECVFAWATQEQRTELFIVNASVCYNKYNISLFFLTLVQKIGLGINEFFAPKSDTPSHRTRQKG